MSSIVFSCHVQHATPQIINLFSPHLEFITHDLRSTRTVIYNFVSANHLIWGPYHQCLSYPVTLLTRTIHTGFHNVITKLVSYIGTIKNFSACCDFDVP